MKKFLALCVVVLLSLPLAAYAAAIGGAETLGKGEVSVGLDQEMVFGGKFRGISWSDGEADNGDYWEEAEKINLQVEQSYRSLTKISYGLLDNLDIYARIGMVRPSFKFKESYNYYEEWVETNNGENAYYYLVEGTAQIKLQGNYALAYGAGIKSVNQISDELLVGIDMQFLTYRNKYKAKGSGSLYWEMGAVGGEPSESGSSEESESGKLPGNQIYYEWHVAPYIAMKIENVTPYLGIVYSDTLMKIKLGGETERFRAKDRVGGFVGVDWRIDENWSLNIEGRFVNETAASAGVTYKF